MVFPRIITTRGRHYLQQVESVWDPKKKRSVTRVLAHLGPCDESGKLLRPPRARVESVHSSFPVGTLAVLYAAARDGNFFARCGQLHPRHHIPHRALLWLAAVASLACLFRLADVIAALVVLRLLLQFLLQQTGLLLLRRRRPEIFTSFRMRLYPLPVWIAIIGSLFVLAARHGSLRQMGWAAAFALVGAAVFVLRSQQAAGS